jgi:hypothetical protein
VVGVHGPQGDGLGHIRREALAQEAQVQRHIVALDRVQVHDPLSGDTHIQLTEHIQPIMRKQVNPRS